MLFRLQTLLAIAAFYPWLGSAQCQDEFDWSSLTPSPSLDWKPCYTGSLQCTRLEVPLDYANSTDEKAAIAIIRIPSPFGLNGSSEYRGPYLFNPGGPGISTIDLVVQGLTDAIHEFRLGDRYDFVGFDPRGVGRSTPQARRFPNQLQNVLWGDDKTDTALAPLSIPGNIGRTIARAQVGNAIYNQTSGSFLPYINTPNTARDMMEIVKAHGRDKINYYGVSYGTEIGAVFATLFPDNIEHMIFDGVVDAEGWFNGVVDTEFTDTDNVMNAFFQACFAAGPERCAFYDSSPKKISENLDALYDQLKALPVPGFNGDDFGIVDYGLLKSYIFNAMYAPYASFPALAEGLAQLAKGNGSAIFALASTPPAFSCNCSSPPVDNMIDAELALLCNDAINVNKTLEEWNEYYEASTRATSFADVAANLFMRCAGWPVRTKDPVRPPFGANTSAPILIVGNTLDPVTPISSARKTQGLFPGSVLLTQNSTGHTSLLSAISLCTSKYMLEYSTNSTLPPAGTVCQVDQDLFPVQNVTSTTSSR